MFQIARLRFLWCCGCVSGWLWRRSPFPSFYPAGCMLLFPIHLPSTRQLLLEPLSFIITPANFSYLLTGWLYLASRWIMVGVEVEEQQQQFNKYAYISMDLCDLSLCHWILGCCCFWGLAGSKRKGWVRHKLSSTVGFCCCCLLFLAGPAPATPPLNRRSYAYECE